MPDFSEQSQNDVLQPVKAESERKKSGALPHDPYTSVKSLTHINRQCNLPINIERFLSGVALYVAQASNL